MNLDELFREASKEYNIYQKVLRESYGALTATILAALIRGEEVKLKGVGKFVPFEKKARSCHDPRTGRKMMSRSRRTILFRVSKKLKMG